MPQQMLSQLLNEYLDAQGQVQSVTADAMAAVQAVIAEDKVAACYCALLTEGTSQVRWLQQALPFSSAQQLRWTVRSDALTQVGQTQLHSDVDVGCYCTLSVALPADYYQLVLDDGQQQVESLLIVAPKRSYQPTVLAKGGRIWGVNIQLYSLRSAQNWGIGDFGDARQLLIEIAQRGGDYLGLNPLHALFLSHPEWCSPYSPASRLWLQPLYIEVTAIEDFIHCAEAQDYLASAPVQQQLSQLRQLDYVDYVSVAQLKLSMLTFAYAHFSERHLATQSSRGKAFLTFVAEGGASLEYFACYQALQAEFGSHSPSWRHFPAQFQDADSAACHHYRQVNRQRIMFYCYLQWIAHEQLAALQAHSQQLGMALGLYRDLAVGTSGDGAECWQQPDLFWLRASVGAPPDALAPQGQNWGLPPFSMPQLQAHGYQPFIELIRRNMQCCGALRIDHILGLMRLWLLPQQATADQGAYYQMPFALLLAIVLLESQRQQCLVIGEDLGTVPDNLRCCLSEAGIFSYKVLLFEIAPDGGFYSPEHYRRDAISAVCTHDMPTLAGYWHCEDLRLAQSLGIYPAEAMPALFDGRAQLKQRLMDSLHWHGHLDGAIDRDANRQAMTWSLMAAIHRHLACGRSQLMSVQLEDLLLMETPVNVPGTSDHYPNWRRKLSQNMATLFQQSQVDHLLRQLSQLRQSKTNPAA